MSDVTQSLNNGQQAITNYDLAKIFVLNNRYQSFSYINSEYNPAILPAGTLMGRIAGTQYVVPHYSGFTDGSQIPIGILADNYTVQSGGSATLSLCVSGDVVKSKVILNLADSMSTVINGRSIEDRIGGDTVGIKLVDSTEMTAFDNQ